MRIGWRSAVLGAGLLAVSAAPQVYADGNGNFGNNGNGNKGIKRVLLISIDGMHAVDFINCTQGVSGANGGNPYCPNLAGLADTGVNYLETSTSKPSDSFPGLMALVTGGSPRTVGAFYDVAYDRSLDPPAATTGNGVFGAPGLCTPGAAPLGTRTEFDEGIDIDQSQLNGGAPPGVDGGIASIDASRLERDPAKQCAPVTPWNFVRANTIFGVVHASGGYTAWSDKHPSYSAVSGPGNGTNVDDYYSPEINSVPVNLPQVKGLNCNPLPDQTAVSGSNSWTDSFANIQCYDSLKVQAILNEIDGKDHSGTKQRPVPNVFGMNFQAVSVGQKLIEKSIGVTGGYTDNIGTPSPALLSEIEFADNSIGKMVAELKQRNLYRSTLIIISAKHGQSPVDSARYLGVSTVPNDPVTTSPATILDSLLPLSERPSNSPPGIGPTEDDISLLWLSDSSQTAAAVGMLESQSPATANIAGIGQIFSGPGVAQMFNPPGLPPNGDPRTPDIIVSPNVGVTYSGSGKKLAEHGGFSHDDTNVMMLVSNPKVSAATVTSEVETDQIAPTILAALGLDPDKLTAVQTEGTQVLPGLGLDSGKSRD
ncbi:MAG TPA: alkaline phosphatase family protein [Stellaceae bacterium]|nr:alkaline phosphatase family protein [Stellaceae bacterium]